jgi:hypothetical protein
MASRYDNRGHKWLMSEKGILVAIIFLTAIFNELNINYIFKKLSLPVLASLS